LRDVQGPDDRDGVGVLGALVVAVSLDASEPQGDAARRARAGLDPVEGHLDDQLGPRRPAS
jgi:hypothetical protein